jgi:cobalamin biosynthesis Mg chelatase CobN
VCTPSATGTFTVNAVVNDSVSKAAYATISLTVNPIPAVTSFVASPSSVTIGGSTDLSVSASGGTGALKYAYTGLPAGCSSANLTALTCTPTSSGTYTVRVYANDSLGMSATSTVSLTVNAQSSQSTSGSQWYLIAGVAGVVVVVVIVALVLMLRRSRKAGGSKEEDKKGTDAKKETPEKDTKEDAPKEAKEDASSAKGKD